MIASIADILAFINGSPAQGRLLHRARSRR